MQAAGKQRAAELWALCHRPSRKLTLCLVLCCAVLPVQALDKGRKDLEKARKVREPLTKKLAEDPQALQTMAAEVEALQQQLAAL